MKKISRNPITVAEARLEWRIWNPQGKVPLHKGTWVCKTVWLWHLPHLQCHQFPFESAYLLRPVENKSNILIMFSTTEVYTGIIKYDCLFKMSIYLQSFIQFLIKWGGSSVYSHVPFVGINFSELRSLTLNLKASKGHGCPISWCNWRNKNVNVVLLMILYAFTYNIFI